ncbi:b121 [Murid betaherpesvirus 8]|uniref:B121 n=1 Tax=Rat cytomegalovirus (isolate England) TaxID=1261657 RepID=A0A0E3SWR3_RCMVE|nr:b121 [Murid betaherpesvirus 8]WPH25025.1 b121 [Murid betaherpesvirus 8]WPH25159.1 b121 [Murid betaherpesvirus 8]
MRRGLLMQLLFLGINVIYCTDNSSWCDFVGNGDTWEVSDRITVNVTTDACYVSRADFACAVNISTDFKSVKATSAKATLLCEIDNTVEHITVRLSDAIINKDSLSCGLDYTLTREQQHAEDLLLSTWSDYGGIDLSIGGHIIYDIACVACYTNSGALFCDYSIYSSTLATPKIYNNHRIVAPSDTQKTHTTPVSDHVTKSTSTVSRNVIKRIYRALSAQRPEMQKKYKKKQTQFHGKLVSTPSSYDPDSSYAATTPAIRYATDRSLRIPSTMRDATRRNSIHSDWLRSTSYHKHPDSGGVDGLPTEHSTRHRTAYRGRKDTTHADSRMSNSYRNNGISDPYRTAATELQFGTTDTTASKFTVKRTRRDWIQPTESKSTSVNLSSESTFPAHESYTATTRTRLRKRDAASTDTENTNTTYTTDAIYTTYTSDASKNQTKPTQETPPTTIHQTENISIGLSTTTHTKNNSDGEYGLNTTTYYNETHNTASYNINNSVETQYTTTLQSVDLFGKVEVSYDDGEETQVTTPVTREDSGIDGNAWLLEHPIVIISVSLVVSLVTIWLICTIVILSRKMNKRIN